MTKQISKNICGKINLGLDILGRREDGYHLVKMIMQSIPLYDTVKVSLLKEKAYGEEPEIATGCRFEASESAILYHGADHPENVPLGDDNIVVKASKKFFEYTKTSADLRIEIVKRIPVAAGLAGGSADAAGTILALNDLLERKLSLEELEKIAVKAGADVPFLLRGGVALSEGIGEQLTSIDSKAKFFVLLTKPFGSVSTKEVYEKYDSLAEERIAARRGMASIERLKEKLEQGETGNVLPEMYNVLSLVTEEIHPDVFRLLEKLEELGAKKSLLSGSGPTCYGIFDSLAEAKKAGEDLQHEMNLESVFAFEIKCKE